MKINLKRFREFAKYLVEVNIVKDCFIVWSEDQLSKVKSNIDTFPFMVLIIPSYDGDGISPDDYYDSSDMLLYILHPRNEKDNMDESLDKMEISEKSMDNFVSFIRKVSDNEMHQYYDLFSEFDMKFHIDPEFNYFGFDGYSISFTL